MEKIIQKIEVLDQKIQSLKKKGKKIVLVNGCFDMYHPGHEYKLSESKKFGDILVVLISTDKYITKCKGEFRPIHSSKERMKEVAKHPEVDFVMIHPGGCPKSFLNQFKVMVNILHPDVYVSSEEYAPNPIELPIIEECGGKVVFTKRIGEFSSTKIIAEKYPQRISNQEHGVNSPLCPRANG